MAIIKNKLKNKVPSINEVDFGFRKDLLVGSVFAHDDPIQRKWLDLQLDFLKKTTNDFDHVCMLYGESEYFKSKTETISLSPFTTNENSKSHLFGLNYLIEVFKSRRKMYNRFLILDSDAFPIRTDWQDLLKDKMCNHDIAICIRTEDVEKRIHASIMLINSEAIDNVGFEIRDVGLDLLGCKEYDIAVSYYEENRESVYSLVRSNKKNLHPALFGIYYDCFYHHCCGSGRSYNLRSRDYWDIVCDKTINISNYTDDLMENPCKFVSNLAGWCPERYAKDE